MSKTTTTLPTTPAGASDQPGSVKPVGSAAEDWQIITIGPFGYYEVDCNSGRKRYVQHDWGYKLKVEPPNNVK